MRSLKWVDGAQRGAGVWQRDGVQRGGGGQQIGGGQPLALIAANPPRPTGNALWGWPGAVSVFPKRGSASGFVFFGLEEVSRVVQRFTSYFVAVVLCLMVLFFVLSGFAGAAWADDGWSYFDQTGPEHWAELDKTYALCASGRTQSPIDISGSAGGDLVNPEFAYQPVPLNLLNNGHTVKVPYAPGSYVKIDGERYNLLQFHLHSPSEHAIEHHSAAAELHLVHQSDDGELAVVSVMLEPGEGMPSAYQVLLEQLPTEAGDKVRSGQQLNAMALLPEETMTYRYEGSLTTPPCSESVHWLVMAEPVELEGSAIAALGDILNHNNRPLQLLNQRSVKLDTSP